MKTYDVVIAEGFQLVHHPHVTGLLNHIFQIELDREEARRRRTQPCDDTGQDLDFSRTSVTPEDFDDLLWPAHERYFGARASVFSRRSPGAHYSILTTS